MPLVEKISADVKAAMKSGDKLRLETLRTVLAALKEKEVEKRTSGGMKPDDELSVLIQASKKRREAADIYAQQGREDLSSQEERELAIIQEYLPKQMDIGELETVIRRLIAETGAASPADFGRVMPAVMKEVKGRIDGKTVQATVRKLLEG
ncbi:MAG TPA: GatB/YqeY domain-containing protein [Candidatus Krumholzibacterium sp.]|nr:GatB/YqeY domain-containing protein [Candidatus Krumholzibacterium sp.]